MVTERTPKTTTVRGAWVTGHPFPLTTDIDERYAEFDRWLANELAAAWEAGFEAGATWSPSGPAGVPSDPPLNPYEGT